MYSYTDSVYFFAPEHWTNREINYKIDEFAKEHFDPSKLGYCKFETNDDIGNPLPKYNENISEGDEPLRYEFFDEFVTVALKTYAIKSNITNRFLLKGKGIPEWMVSKYKDEKTDIKTLEKIERG